MEYTSTCFILLFPFVALVYYLVPAKARQYYLLSINLLFYASFGHRSIVVIIAVGTIAWVAAKVATRTTENVMANAIWTYGLIAIIVAVMIVFKLGSSVTGSIVAPLGISYYSLQAISYVLDVKRGDAEKEENLVKLIVYLSFFPTIVSGPIYRYKDFIVEHNRNIYLKPEYDRIVNGIIYMIYGYYLKLVIAARAGIAVDRVFENHQEIEYGWIVLAAVAVLYSVQIFTDFAGYSAIVIGIAQILGYTIPENFIAPYLSTSVKEFWGRWHVSLSGWLKDYVYIPLGGNRKGRIRKYINIMITFAVSGLWHGINSIHFLIWGVIHGLYQVFGDITYELRESHVENVGIIRRSWFHSFLKRVFTFAFVTVAWIFFRTGVKDAVLYLYEMFTSAGISRAINGGMLSVGLSTGDWILLIVSLLLVYSVDKILYCRKLRFDQAVALQGSMARCITVVVLVLTILVFGVYGDRHDAGYFIYRGF